MNFNYKIILSILLSLILGYVIYIYFFRKPVSPGEILKDIQEHQHFLQKELLLPAAHIRAPPVPEQEDDDNLTRESLYEEILKLNVLKNPVDFLFKFNMNDMQDVFSTNQNQNQNQKQSSRIEECQDELEVGQDQEDSLEEKIVEYPKETEAFGNLEQQDQEELSKKIFSDMINMDRELKGNKEEIPIKKKIAIKKK
jgi:hypothetical protein